MSLNSITPDASQYALPFLVDKERLAELHSLDILDTPADKYFDRYTRLVAEIFKVPIVAVTMIDEDRQWIKSAVGMEVGEKALDESFCIHAFEKNMLEVPDTLQDDFFRHHSLVVAPPFIRFYMGSILRGPTGQPLGALYIMDTESRYLSQTRRNWLETFGHIVEELIIHGHVLKDAHDDAKRNNHLNTLTGLPDHTLFSTTLKHLVRMTEKEKNYLAVLYLHINKIDEISRVHGRPTRDAMLCVLAERLSGMDSKILAIGHLNQSCFAAVITLPLLGHVFDLVTHIVDNLKGTIEVKDTKFQPDIDVGISLCPIDGLSAEDLMENAKAALEGPKSNAGLYFFSHDVAQRVLRRDTIEQHLESALTNHELTKNYQPLVTADGSHILGFEALARWHSAELGNVSPADFVPIAEKNPRLSKMLTEWSLKMVASEMSQWPLRLNAPPCGSPSTFPPLNFLKTGS